MGISKNFGRVGIGLLITLSLLLSVNVPAQADTSTSRQGSGVVTTGHRFRSLRQAQTAGKISGKLAREIEKSGSATAIVLFGSDRAMASGSASHPSTSRDQEASRATFRATKAAVLDALDRVTVVDPLEYLPMAIVRVSDRASLLALSNASAVVGIAAPTVSRANLAQSLPQINATAAQNAGYYGSGSYVAVLDTGIDLRQGAFGCTAVATPSTCKVVASYDTAPNDGYLDDSGHGTNVGGIVAGVAPGARILSYDVFAGSSTNETYVIAAINDVLAKRAVGWNIRAVNMSLGNYNTYFDGSCTTMPNTSVVNPYIDAFSRLRAAGILPVVASGNNAFGNDTYPRGSFQVGIQYPACTPGALSVGAVHDSARGYVNFPSFNCHDNTTAQDQVTCFSQVGSTLSILAPGSEISAAGHVYNGTSQAAPHVAGAVAVLAAARPSASAAGVEQALVGTGPVIHDPRSGYSTRRLDVVAALNALTPADSTPPIVTAPVQQIAGGTIGTTVPVTVSWSASDASGIAAYELWISLNGGAFVKDTKVPALSTSFTYLLTPGTRYQFFVRAKDASGNWSPDGSGYGPGFTPTITDDRSTSISYLGAAGSTTRTWSYSAWSAAYGTTLTASSRAGEYARFTFTGRDVAWVASLGNNRGQAKVFIDGVLFKTVVLYQATGAGARIAVAKHWSTSGTHTIDVQTISASGYPTMIDVDAFVVIK